MLQVRKPSFLLPPLLRNISSTAKLGGISTQRRKVIERGASGAGVETPDTNRAVGGSDRM